MSKPISWPNDPKTIDLALAKSFGLNEAEWLLVLDKLGRVPGYAELGVISVMWSEHCSYKSSRVHLRRLPSEGPQVVQGPGENAGAVDIGDGYCAVFKMESHNHPSFIEPYQGAATGVGGILRDVFTMGARPIALLNSLRFGEPKHQRTAELVSGVVAGIGGYGNCMGVPTVGGEVQFDASYNGNILVNAFALGIAKSDELFFGTASGVGNPVFYVGSRTGRDGIHGATMASAQFEEDADTKLPTVQVGDPFMEKLLLEACLEIFKTDCLAGVQDMGAAGLTSSSVEMAARAGTGLELDLDSVPRRTQALSPYEILLSESQERMLMVAKKGREQEIISVCKKWGLDVAEIGRVTNTGRFVCKATPGFDPWTEPDKTRDPQVVVDLPLSVLTDDAPCYDRPQKVVKGDFASLNLELPQDCEELLLRLLRHPNIGSRRSIYSQYDHVVRDGTIVRPGEGDAAVVRVFREENGRSLPEKYLAMSADCNGRFVRLDPYMGAAMAVAECARNVACVGAKPLGLTDCLNFGNPEIPETMASFSKSIDGIADACKALDIAVVSGNVSLYNETDGQAILPTPTVAVVGQIDSVDEIRPMGFSRAGDEIAQLGHWPEGNLGGSECAYQLTGELCGPAQSIDLAAEKALQDVLLASAKEGLLSSAHDISDGGLAVSLAESCMLNGFGAKVTLPEASSAKLLFSEEPTRVVVSYEPENRVKLETLCQRYGLPFVFLGTVATEHLSVSPYLKVAVKALKNSFDAALDEILPQSE
ncbi:MAG: phosphoribosylformylglycinamidine synthase subunit PurL [Myxococcales bacterium]|nr:MAG: phosphoribosylformylglycinamidine synthase subunit PurL [Myxococcales bacterium]